MHKKLCRTILTFAAVMVGPVGGYADAGQSQPSQSLSETSSQVGAVRIVVSLKRDGTPEAGNDSVAWLPEIRATEPGGRNLKIAQREKQFEPRLAVVSIGSTVDFPNYDRVFHNVFSLSTAKEFDLGLYRKGKSKAMRFDRPGLVQVYCNIHPHMAAYLMIVDSSRHGAADTNGTIVLENIPEGTWTVEGWNVRAGFFSQEINIQPGRTSDLTIELDISSWRETPHLNKYGKDYPPPDDDDFRY